MQALGDECMHSDKERRPSFTKLLVSLDELLGELVEEEESRSRQDYRGIRVCEP